MAFITHFSLRENELSGGSNVRLYLINNESLGWYSMDNIIPPFGCINKEEKAEKVNENCNNTFYFFKYNADWWSTIDLL